MKLKRFLSEVKKNPKVGNKPDFGKCSVCGEEDSPSTEGMSFDFDDNIKYICDNCADKLEREQEEYEKNH